MEITVNIPDEVADQARKLDLTPENYVARLVAGEAAKPESEVSTEERMAKLERFFKQISSHSEKIPRLPDEAFTRESFYSDHD